HCILRDDADNPDLDLESLSASYARWCLDFDLGLSRPLVVAEWIGQAEQGNARQLWKCAHQERGQGTGSEKRKAGGRQSFRVHHLTEIIASSCARRPLDGRLPQIL